MIGALKVMAAALFALLLAPWPTVAAPGAADVSSFYSRNSTETLIRVYEDPARQEWQKPQEVVDRLSVQPGDVVADIGAGSGYFSVLFAKKVGSGGTVFAVDTDRDMLDHIRQRATKEGLDNVRPLLAKKDDPLLAKDSTDLIFICNTYMFISVRERYLPRLKDILTSDGRLAIVSYNLVDSPEGPPIHTRVSREKTIREVVGAGFVLDAEYYFLPYQHFLVFKKR